MTNQMAQSLDFRCAAGPVQRRRIDWGGAGRIGVTVAAPLRGEQTVAMRDEGGNVYQHTLASVLSGVRECAKSGFPTSGNRRESQGLHTGGEEGRV